MFDNVEYRGEISKEEEVEKIIMKNGKIYKLDDITHVLILKRSTSKEGAFYSFSLKIKDRIDCEGISNQCYAIAMATKFMQHHNVDFDTALNNYLKYMEENKKD